MQTGLITRILERLRLVSGEKSRIIETIEEEEAVVPEEISLEKKDSSKGHE